MKATKFVPFLMFVLIASVSFASDQMVPRPYADGRDVLVPDGLIKNIPGYKTGDTVYIAYDDNEWYSTDVEHQKYKPVLVKEEGYWRAREMKGQRFHPVLLVNGKPVWGAKVEKTWNLPPAGTVRNGIDYTNPDGPCIFVP